MPVSRRLRFEILRRDNHACAYCGATAPDARLTVDHVIPVALGGSDEPSNLVTACSECNSGKASISPDAPIVDSVAADALRWRKAMEACAIGDMTERQERDEHRQEFLRIWESWTYESGGKRCTIALPNNWPLTVDQLIGAGLMDADIADAVDVAMRTRSVDDEFRYFAGVCWNRVRERQRIARLMLDAEDKRGGA